LLVNDELLRAIKTESAEALMFWFGVGVHAVWNWRRSFGIKQLGTEGSRRLHEQSTKKANDTCRGRSLNLTPAQRREWSKRFIGMKRTPWTDEEDRLVLALSDEDAAKQTGRTLAAVQARRRKLTT